MRQIQNNSNIGLNANITVITLNENRLSTVNKGLKLPKWIKNKNTTICCL